MKLATLQRKADAIVKKSSQEIIVGVYLKMIDAHNEFCGCDYCILLKKYVAAKIRVCKMKRLYYLYYDGSISAWKEVEYQQAFIKILKQQKDSIKLKLH